MVTLVIIKIFNINSIMSNDNYPQQIVHIIKELFLENTRLDRSDSDVMIQRTCECIAKCSSLNDVFVAILECGALNASVNFLKIIEFFAIVLPKFAKARGYPMDMMKFDIDVAMNAMHTDKKNDICVMHTINHGTGWCHWLENGGMDKYDAVRHIKDLIKCIGGHIEMTNIPRTHPILVNLVACDILTTDEQISSALKKIDLEHAVLGHDKDITSMYELFAFIVCEPYFRLHSTSVKMIAYKMYNHDRYIRIQSNKNTNIPFIMPEFDIISALQLVDDNYQNKYDIILNKCHDIDERITRHVNAIESKRKQNVIDAKNREDECIAKKRAIHEKRIEEFVQMRSINRAKKNMVCIIWPASTGIFILACLYIISHSEFV